MKYLIQIYKKIIGHSYKIETIIKLTLIEILIIPVEILYL